MKNNLKNAFKKVVISFSKEEYDRYNYSKREKIIVYPIVAIVLFFVFRSCYRDERIINSKCKTVGTVVSTGNNVEFKYTVDGKEYNKEKSTRYVSSKIEINNYDKFWVYYDCEDPSSSIIDFDERYMDTIPPADETK